MVCKSSSFASSAPPSCICRHPGDLRLLLHTPFSGVSAAAICPWLATAMCRIRDTVKVSSAWTSWADGRKANNLIRFPDHPLSKHVSEAAIQKSTAIKSSPTHFPIHPPSLVEPAFPSSSPATYSSVYLLCSSVLLSSRCSPSPRPQCRVLIMAKLSAG